MEKEITQEAEPEQPEVEAKESAPEEQAPPRREEVTSRGHQRAESQDSRGMRRGRGRRRPCVMCADKMPFIDYKDFNFLRRFLSDRGRIESRRKSGTCAKHQRALAQAIKRARHLALLPYTAEHVRTGVGPSR